MNPSPFKDPKIAAGALATIDTILEMMDERIALYDQLPKKPGPGTNPLVEVVSDYIVGAARLTELQTVRDRIGALKKGLEKARYAREGEFSG